MSPSPRTPCHDPRWATSNRTASLATIVLNAGLVLGLVLIQTAPKPPISPQPLSLEFRVPAMVEPPLPLPEKTPAVSPEPATVVQPPPPAETPAKPEPVKPEAIRPPQKKEAAKTPPEPTAQPVRPEPVTQPPQAVPPTLPVAQAPVTPTPPLAAPATAAVSTAPAAAPAEPTDMAHILTVLAQLIERHKDYPKAARRAGYEGVVIMTVSMDKNGVVTDWSLHQGSEHALLDKAAEKTFGRLIGQKIQGANLEDTLRIVVPIKYELRGQG